MTTTANWSTEMDAKLAQLKRDPVDYYIEARRRALMDVEAPPRAARSDEKSHDAQERDAS